MKKALTLLTLLASVYSYGQQDPYFTHFKDVIQAYNPAGAGHKINEICISGLTHHQWRDYDDMTAARGTNGTGELDDNYTNIAPVTYNINVSSLFNLNASGSQKLGTGISIIQDEVGFTASTGFMLNLNYRRQFQGGDHEISGGVGLGGTQWGWTDPKYISRQQLDPNIPIAGGNEMKFDLSIGAMYRKAHIGNNINDFYAGLSMTNVNQAQYQISVATQGELNATLNHKYVPHYYTVVGADWKLNNGMVLEPALLAKYGLLNKAYVPQIDLNVTTLFANTFRAGLAYRQWGNSDAASLLLGYQNGPLQVGYSYDITLSNVQLVSNGTHEIMVKYCIPFAFETRPEIIRESVRFL
ncbi:MAG: PorP/SprF family type IX secretion system membrane protein [Bacteroidia bacterium]